MDFGPVKHPNHRRERREDQLEPIHSRQVRNYRKRNIKTQNHMVLNSVA